MLLEYTVNELLSRSEGLAIGTQYWKPSISNYLMDQLPLFNKQNVKTIYSEIVASDNDKFLQNYFAHPSDDNLEKIRPVLHEAYQNDDTLHLIKAMQQAGVRLVGIDVQPRSAVKAEMVNELWAAHVQADRASHPEGKFIVHGGGFYMRGEANFVDVSPKYEPKGTLPQLLDIPFIIIEVDDYFTKMNLKGNDTHMLSTTDTRKGALEITISPEYKAAPLRQAAPKAGADLKPLI